MDDPHLLTAQEFRLPVVAVSMIVATACAPIHAASAQPRASATTQGPLPMVSSGSVVIIDQAGPPPLVLKDTSPDQLSAQLHLTVGGYDDATRDVAELSIVFLHGGRWVRFEGSERLTCDGIPIPGPGTAFDVKVPTETIAGKLVSCIYTSGLKSATLTFSAPPSLAILSPENHARIARSKTTTVRFRVGGHSTMFWVTALGQNSKTWAEPKESHPTQVVLDTSRFLAGPGSITAGQFFTLPDLHGPGFASVDAAGEATQQVNVIWA